MEEPDEDVGVLKAKSPGAEEAPAKEEAKGAAPKIDTGLADLLDIPTAVPEKKVEAESTITMLEEVFKDIGGQPILETPASTAPTNMPVAPQQQAVSLSSNQPTSLLGDDVRNDINNV